MVNHINNANMQAQAVVASEGAVNANLLQKEMDKIISQTAVDKTDAVKQLVETGLTKDMSSQLLKDLVTRVSQLGVSVGKTEQSEAKKEQKNEALFSNSSDSVTLSSQDLDSRGIMAIKGIGAQTSSLKKQIDQRWERIEEKLIEQGKSQKEISVMEQQFKASQSQTQLFKLLKEAAMIYYLDSSQPLNKVIRRRGFAEIMTVAGIELSKEAIKEAREELRGFVLHELENQLIAKTFSQDNDFKQCYELAMVGDTVQADCEQYVETVWPKLKENLGLNLIDVPPQMVGLAVDVELNDKAKKEREQFELSEDEQKDLILARLRALYMQISLRPGSLRSAETWFKIWKLKSGAMQLKIITRDIDEKVKQEARVLAKIKTMQMLYEALLERATYFGKGVEQELAEKRVKVCLKNLERLGFRLSDEDLLNLRNKADQEMKAIAEKELSSTKNEKRSLQLIKVLEKIEQELENNREGA